MKIEDQMKNLQVAKTSIMDVFEAALNEARDAAYQAEGVADSLCGTQPVCSRERDEPLRGDSVADRIESASSDLRDVITRINSAMSRINIRFSLQKLKG